MNTLRQKQHRSTKVKHGETSTYADETSLDVLHTVLLLMMTFSVLYCHFMCINSETYQHYATTPIINTAVAQALQSNNVALVTNAKKSQSGDYILFSPLLTTSFQASNFRSALQHGYSQHFLQLHSFSSYLVCCSSVQRSPH